MISVVSFSEIVKIEWYNFGGKIEVDFLDHLTLHLEPPGAYLCGGLPSLD